MKISDIGILFDVSGSMQSPFNSFSNQSYKKRSDEIINIVERICNRKNIQKNEQIRIFSVLFGGRSESIFDFCSLLEISNKTFKHQLTSSNEKVSKHNYNGYDKKFVKILSENGNKSLYLDDYLYCDSGPTERVCELGYYLLEDDYYLREKIYDKLPEKCKWKAADIAIGGLNFFGFFKGDVNKGTTDIINDIYQICMDSYISRIINEERSLRVGSGNKLRFINGNDLVNIKKNLEGKLASPDKTNFNIIDLFKKYIYGNTPLYTALNLSFDNFKKQSNGKNNKILFIISDGELNDVDKSVDYIGEINKKAKENNVIIVSIFLTSNSIPKEEKLYDTVQNHFTSGSKDLFLMSSTLTYENPVIKFLIQKKWDIPSSGQCNLFVEINNTQNLNNFIDLMNEAVGELNNKYNKETAKNPNSLINLLSSTAVNDYVNSEVINKVEAKEQEGDTCFANAIAIGIYLASARVIGRKNLDFKTLRDTLINKYGTDGAKTETVLKECLGNYRLHYKAINEEEARKAIMETRPCVARFELTLKQWRNFQVFYINNPSGILTKEDLNKEETYIPGNAGSSKRGHCVVLTHISKDYLKFLNSYGTNFGENGYFKVKSADVLNCQFFDIFWDIPDLNNEEINYFNNYMEKLKNDVNSELFD